ncbi:unnamed protein product (macronuclear) [Paramecium tetraurelia]|uniref:Uncharacterized protein n=1 Tax=Paramecium tetraurelia TaxID=5888 RepID=A0DSM8_PARTE|nr:uncharacterized protein GSPATT00019738001 [Paramecium tetraurelia]CAK86045.1 unnamed protein product [Paramecium tetraurelia]|eukprot:XP_001453442.1 hypothetical protein (macronuclear) [Paramecium tetraurelia strain d4-2]
MKFVLQNTLSLVSRYQIREVHIFSKFSLQPQSKTMHTSQMNVNATALLGQIIVLTKKTAVSSTQAVSVVLVQSLKKTLSSQLCSLQPTKLRQLLNRYYYLDMREVQIRVKALTP